MTIVGSIVEGHGDATALPVLIRRCVAEVRGGVPPVVLPPHRVPKTRLLRRGELERTVELVARKVGEDGVILILIDADDDCPAALGTELRTRAQSSRPDRRLDVVLAKREFEAWFVAASISLRGARGLDPNASPPHDPEAVRDAKGWLDARMTDGYRETIDQAAFAATFSLAEARVASSFRKFERALRAVGLY